MQTTLGSFTGESSLAEIPSLIRGIKDGADPLLGKKQPQYPFASHLGSGFLV